MALTPSSDASAETLLGHLRPVLASAPFPDRRLGRALAFLTLYEADLARHAPPTILDRLVAATHEEPLPASGGLSDETLAAAAAYAREVVEGVATHRREIDEVIHQRAPAWPLAQMSAIDRNVLRVGLYESLYSGAKVPVKAAINEAVELAKLFGSETSAKFVNGVLGRAVEPGEHAR